ncbi:hypothetical protein BDV95DRAFT_616791 [Massariosphaeria phaeospora]|uniref:Uncharacterized protein n=1 Tax=Massariosphaeria phaeospora TaxID=100035 RepID=A0A7C8MPU0_9PLEO|nr:hypothetical protein BDV95DRAFT_616791 [Massariosphaeria phaeospora]
MIGPGLSRLSKPSRLTGTSVVLSLAALLGVASAVYVAYTAYEARARTRIRTQDPTLVALPPEQQSQEEVGVARVLRWSVKEHNIAVVLFLDEQFYLAIPRAMPLPCYISCGVAPRLLLPASEKDLVIVADDPQEYMAMIHIEAQPDDLNGAHDGTIVVGDEPVGKADTIPFQRPTHITIPTDSSRKPYEVKWNKLDKKVEEILNKTDKRLVNFPKTKKLNKATYASANVAFAALLKTIVQNRNTFNEDQGFDWGEGRDYFSHKVFLSLFDPTCRQYHRAIMENFAHVPLLHPEVIRDQASFWTLVVQGIYVKQIDKLTWIRDRMEIHGEYPPRTSLTKDWRPRRYPMVRPEIGEIAEYVSVDSEQSSFGLRTGFILEKLVDKEESETSSSEPVVDPGFTFDQLEAEVQEMSSSSDPKSSNDSGSDSVGSRASSSESGPGSAGKPDMNSNLNTAGSQHANEGRHNVESVQPHYLGINKTQHMPDDAMGYQIRGLRQDAPYVRGPPPGFSNNERGRYSESDYLPPNDTQALCDDRPAPPALPPGYNHAARGKYHPAAEFGQYMAGNTSMYQFRTMAEDQLAVRPPPGLDSIARGKYDPAAHFDQFITENAPMDQSKVVPGKRPPPRGFDDAARAKYLSAYFDPYVAEIASMIQVQAMSDNRPPIGPPPGLARAARGDSQTVARAPQDINHTRIGVAQQVHGTRQVYEAAQQALPQMYSSQAWPSNQLRNNGQGDVRYFGQNHDMGKKTRFYQGRCRQIFQDIHAGVQFQQQYGHLYNSNGYLQQAPAPEADYFTGVPSLLAARQRAGMAKGVRSKMN